MNVLIIEDNFDHIELERKICTDAFGVDSQIHHIPELGEGLEHLVSNKYDVCLCDLSFPESTAAETIEKLEALPGTQQTPIVVLTSFSDENDALDLLNHGIQDYMLKSELSIQQIRRIVTFAIERKKYQQQLEERNRDQQTFCRSLSHDFRGKIGNIKLTAELLEKTLINKQRLDARQTEWFSFIMESSEHMLGLVDGLTTYLRVDQNGAAFEVIPLEPLGQQLIRALTTEHQLAQNTLTLDCDESITVTADPTQTYLMLQNLVNNAIKFSQPDPAVSIRARHLPDQQLVEICVEDNGVGMTNDQVNRIFEPFAREHESFSGTGLGLSIVSRIVQRHNGTIRVESEANNGSSFIVQLPAH